MAGEGRAAPIGSWDELISALRAIEPLRAKGKSGENFYLKSRAFLHFHAGANGTYADVRFGDDWEEVPAATPEERGALVARVRAHVAR